MLHLDGLKIADSLTTHPGFAARVNMDTALLQESLIGLGVATLKIVIAFSVGIAAITFGLRVFGKMTKNIDEDRELKGGNLALGLLMGAVVLAYTNVIGSGLDQVTDGVLSGTWQVRLTNFIGGLLNLAIAVTVASFTIRYALLAFEKISKNIDPWAEIKNRNYAIAFLLAGMVYGLSQVTSRGVNEIGAGIGDFLYALIA